MMMSTHSYFLWLVSYELVACYFLEQEYIVQLEFIFNLLIFYGYMLCRFVVMISVPRLDKSFLDTTDQVLNSLLDFNPSEWGLPPFDDNRDWNRTFLLQTERADE